MTTARSTLAAALRWIADRVDPFPPATPAELRQRLAAAEAQGRARADAALQRDRARSAHPSTWQPTVIPPQLRERTGTQPPQFGRRRPVVGQDEGQ